MKIFKFLSVLAIGLIVFSLLLKAQSLDVGDDPTKLKIVKTMVINVPVDCVFKKWSPNGEFISFTTIFDDPDSPLFTYIFNKYGQIVKKISGYFINWSSDSSKIVTIDESYCVWICLIGSNDKKKTSLILRGNSNICYLYNNKLTYIKLNECYEYDIPTSTSSLKFSAPLNSRISNVFETDKYIYYSQIAKSNSKLIKYSKSDNSYVMQIQGIGATDFYVFNNSHFIISSQLNSNIDYYNQDGQKLISFSVFSLDESNQAVGFYPAYSDVSPNGKLIAITYCSFSSHETDGIGPDIYYGDIYCINLSSGRKQNITSSDKQAEIMLGWSSQGNRVIYKENISNTFILAELSN